ncbi:MAG: Ig-like domain-containing protein [Bacteroidales bacterium]|nr:Ig-like domain-containing protein [Bacteroidales bacterium]
MKKYILIASAAAVAALLLSSCQMENLEGQPVESAPGMVLHAEAEAPLTKTTLSGNDALGYEVRWQSGDTITVVNGNGSVGVFTSFSGGDTRTDFVRTRGYEGPAPYKAWYPAELYNEGTPAFPAVQKYTAGSPTGSPMYAESADDKLMFKNIGGIIRLNISTELADQAISKIILQANQGLSGTITNAATLADNAYVATVAAGGTLTLECGEGVAISSTPTPFFMSVPATTYSGLTITAVTATGIRQTWSLKDGRAVPVGRSSITDINLEFTKTVSYTDLSARGTANTYIVSEAGAYKFNATVKGNGGLDPATGATATPIQKSDISGVTVLWEIIDHGNAIAYADGIYDIGYYDGYIYFSTPSTFAQGNAYVAIFKDLAGGNAGVYDKDVDEILWSWMIWATPAPGDVEYNGSLFMDRNLGATTLNGDRGFLYQWGRKDPFSAANGGYSSFTFYPAAAFNTVAGIQTIDYGIKHPATHVNNGDENSWMSEAEYNLLPWRDDVKTIYDPCPLGWRVPTAAQQNGYSGLPATGFSNAAGEYGNPGSGYYRSSTVTSYPKAYAYRQNGEQNNWGTNPAMAIRPVEDKTVAKDLSTYTDLSATASANSYIVPALGDYKFRATVKGNGAASLAGVSATTGSSSIAGADLVWASFGTSVAPSSVELIRRVGYQDGYVYFSTGAEYKEGNAVVAIKDAGGNILWSWHLWLTDDEISEQAYPGGAVFMDRNLGALAATSGTESYGLLYQWGRKDPFLNTKYANGGDITPVTVWQPAVYGAQQLNENTGQTPTHTVAEVVQWPNKFIYTPQACNVSEGHGTGGGLWASDQTAALWGSEKTIFDPCPPGWKVPETALWDNSFRERFFNTKYSNPMSVALPAATAIFPSVGVKTTVSVYQYHYNSNNPLTSYYVRNDGGIAVPPGYHFRLWASDGALLSDSFGSNQDPTAGVFSYDQIMSYSTDLMIDLRDMFWDNYAYQIGHYEGRTYQKAVPASGLSVRCVRETSQAVQPASVSIPATASVAQFSSIQLPVTTVPAQSSYFAQTWTSDDESVAKVDSHGRVLGMATGTCHITLSTVAGSSSCTVTVTAPSSTMTAVDMGLPSGTKWANMNWGANAPSADGTFISWNEAPGMLSSSNWRLPTKAECEELVNNSVVSLYNSGGVSGLLVTSTINGNCIFLPASGYKKSEYGYIESESPRNGYFWSSDRDQSSYKPFYLMASMYDGSLHVSYYTVESHHYTTVRPVAK